MNLAFLYADPMSIGSRLRQLRKANKLSGEKFGELCGVTKGAVSQWESDQVAPPTDRLLELRTHLPFSFDWLLDGEGSPVIYTTTDPTLAELLRVLEPRAEYFKKTALKNVLNTLDAVDHAQVAEEAPQPAAMNTHRPADRRRGIHFYDGPERRGVEKKNDAEK